MVMTAGATAAVAEPAKQQRTIALLLPTLNELQGLKAVLPEIDRALVDDIIVIDGGSRDGTVEFALDAGLTVVSQLRPGRRGPPQGQGAGAVGDRPVRVGEGEDDGDARGRTRAHRWGDQAPDPLHRLHGLGDERGALSAAISRRACLA